MTCNFCVKPVDESEAITIGSGEHFHPDCYKISISDKMRMQPMKDTEE